MEGELPDHLGASFRILLIEDRELVTAAVAWIAQLATFEIDWPIGNPGHVQQRPKRAGGPPGDPPYNV